MKIFTRKVVQPIHDLIGVHGFYHMGKHSEATVITSLVKPLPAPFHGAAVAGLPRSIETALYTVPLLLANSDDILEGGKQVFVVLHLFGYPRGYGPFHWVPQHDYKLHLLHHYWTERCIECLRQLFDYEVIWGVLHDHGSTCHVVKPYVVLYEGFLDHTYGLWITVYFFVTFVGPVEVVALI